MWVTPEQALRVALNAARLTTPDLGLLMITAAWTGARWGELTGLHRDNTHLHPDGTGHLVIDPQVGALHEVDGQLFLGPPKTAESARTIALPPFLVALLRQHLDTHRHRHVFVTRGRGVPAPLQLLPPRHAPRRRRHHPPPPTPRSRWRRSRRGLTFHGFRHSHKTWLIADRIPDVAQARRLGHRIPDKIQHIYSHVAPELETRLLDALQHRWTAAIADLTDLTTTSWARAVARHHALAAGIDGHGEAEAERYPLAS